MLNLRLGGVLAGVVSLTAAVLIATPSATAAGDTLTLTTPAIAIDRAGNGQVWAHCNLSKTCTGWIGWDEVADPAARVGTSYSIAAGASKYIKIGMRTQLSTNNGAVSEFDPYSVGSRVNVGSATIPVWQVSPARIKVSPTGGTQQLWTTKTQTALTGGQQKISGVVASATSAGTMTEVKVELWKPVKGGSYTLVATSTVGTGTLAPGASGNYSLMTPKATFVNNVSSTDYRLKIRARDDQQEQHTWWWRGTASNPFTGGARYVRTATVIKPSVAPIVANFRFGSIQGTAKLDSVAVRDLSVSAVAAPHDFSSGLGRTNLRELDVESCGDEYSRVRTNAAGGFRMDFLPAPSSGSENKYLVYARQGISEGWNKTASGSSYGSCYQALDFGWARQGMQFGGSGVLGGVSVNVVTAQNAPGKASIELIKSKFADERGVGSAYSDQWVMFRKYIPGLSRNDSPVVVQNMAGDSGPTTFKLPPGRYWVETGRRGASCAMWYPSVYPDNNAYLKGEDRGAERWKTVAGKAAEYQKSYDMGYVAKTPPSGYKGWMYREYCKTINQGWISPTKLDILPGSSATVVIPIADRAITAGAVVSGTVKRAGGKTNKEMMVRLSSTDTAWGVIRVDLTDSKGKFYVAGLPAGTYKVQVNSDSWRGIGRSFTGTKTITVKAGKSYSIGTLNFSG